MTVDTINASIVDDVTVNGVKIIEPNRRCFNGFVHVTEDVIYSLPNMADYLNNYEGFTHNVRY